MDKYEYEYQYEYQYKYNYEYRYDYFQHLAIPSVSNFGLSSVSER